ncbi:sensor histidine kinase [Streptomyces sp. ML-6]|uniref:sensor histidine kinase n=1 Tax=Streptomyces sp. ML-6 TaxID=2982693 RepID=UPI0024C0E329|nr:sensor histidine kinase [Streptomyces sp. ML-6]MDK0520613.1 sensor histidine kinase [Streptomyces sp. ML-6]
MDGSRSRRGSGKRRVFADWWQRVLRHPRAVDAGVAAVLWGFAVFSSTLTEARIVRLPPLGFSLAALVPSVVLLLGQRRFPRTVVVVTALCGGFLGAMSSRIGFDPTPSVAGAALVALYLLALHTDLRTTSVYTAAVAVVLLSLSLALGKGTLLRPDQVGTLACVLLAGAVGESVRTRRDHLAAVEARAELAERTREEEARRRVGEERTRIARELHDIVAHHITLAHAQAATAAYLLRSRPDQAQKTLDQLAGTTSSALRELKATVGLLRREGDPETPLEPAPGLARLPELIASFEQTGLAVSVAVEGEARPLPPGADLTAYRIVQEALTNVTKHSGGTSASVRLCYARRLLTLTVSDDGHAPPPPPPPAGTEGPASTSGYGLIGMRERALSAGGRLAAGHRPGGGFEVTTELPLETTESGGVSGADDEERTAR